MISVFGCLVEGEEIDAVQKTLESQWLGLGKCVTNFENGYKNKFGLTHFSMVDSGSNALYLALKAMNLPFNSEVIVPSYTWVACAQAVILNGLRPVFCDVDLKTMNVTIDTVKQKITDTTSAIMVVHYAGLAVDMDPIIELGLPIIEDCAHCAGSTYKGKPVGELGEVGIYSFDAVKNLTAGEGGGVASKHKNIMKNVLQARYCGIGKSGFEASMKQAGNTDKWWEYNIGAASPKCLPNNITASIANAQLQKIDELQERRKAIWNFYNEQFKNSNVLTPVNAQNGDVHSYFTYCIRVKSRDELANYLLSNKIYTTLRYHPLHLNAVYGQTDITLRNSEELNSTALSIPLHPRLSDDEVELVADLILSFQ